MLFSLHNVWSFMHITACIFWCLCFYLLIIIVVLAKLNFSVPSLSICIFPLSWTRSYIAESFFKLRAVTTSGYFPFCYSREFVSATSHYFYFCLENWSVCRLVIFLQWLVVHSHIVPLFFLCYRVHSYFVQVFFARVIRPFIHPRVIFILLVVIGLSPGRLFHFIF